MIAIIIITVDNKKCAVWQHHYHRPHLDYHQLNVKTLKLHFCFDSPYNTSRPLPLTNVIVSSNLPFYEYISCSLEWPIIPQQKNRQRWQRPCRLNVEHSVELNLTFMRALLFLFTLVAVDVLPMASCYCSVYGHSQLSYLDINVEDYTVVSIHDIFNIQVQLYVIHWTISITIVILQRKFFD